MLYELPLYEKVADPDTVNGTTTDRTVGEDIIARREASGYFHHHVTQYDGCRYRNYTSHDGLGWWDYQTLVDNEISNIQNALGTIWSAEECEYRRWTEFKTDHREKLPLSSPTVDWTSYLLTDDQYALRETAFSYAAISQGNSDAKSVFDDWMSWTQAQRDYNADERAESCRMDAYGQFLSQARGKNQTELRAWKDAIQANSNWTNINSEYSNTWGAWDRAVRDLEEYDTYDKEDYAAQLSNWIDRTIVSQSNFTDIKNALPSLVTNLNDQDRIREDQTSNSDTISTLQTAVSDREREIAPDSNTYSAACKNETWYQGMIDNYIGYLDDIDDYNRTEWNDISGYSYSAAEAPWKSIRDELRSWGSSGNNDTLVRALNGSSLSLPNYYAEQVAFAYQWLRDDTADSETDKFADKKNLLKTVIDDLLIKINRNATDENNIYNRN